MMNLVNASLPITALFVDDHEQVWFGEGPCVKHVVDGVIVVLCILDTIYSVRIIKQLSKNLLIVAAGTLIFSIDKTDGTAKRIDVGVKDWILDISMDIDGNAFCVTAHGHVCRISLNDCAINNKSWHLTENALFYSAHLIDSKTVAFGTIFDGLWIYRLDPHTSELKLQRKLQDHHKGSVFGICSNSHHLVSCSDDRTIAIWNKSTFDLVKVLRGHDARVWCVDCNDQSIVSGSEDGTVRLWSLALNEAKILACHSGKHVWAVNICQKIVYSGGGDAALRMSCLQNLSTESIALPDLKAFHVSSDNSLFSLSSCGSVIKNGINYYQSRYLRKFCVFDSLADWLACGDLAGHLHIISRLSGAVTVYSVSGSKILKLVILSAHLIFLQDAQLNVILLFLDDNLNIVRRVANCFDTAIIAVAQLERSLVLGTRSGMLIFTDLNLGEKFSVKVGEDSVTGLLLHNHQYVSFCTRGGQIGMVDVVNQKIMSIEPKCPISYEGIHRDGDQMYAFGFHDKDFVVQRVWDKGVTSRHPCGGSHRLWQFVNGKLYYLRDQHIHSVDTTSIIALAGPVKPGLQGLETRCIVEHQGQLISGGEDGSLILFDANLHPKYKIKFESSIKGIFKTTQGMFVICGTKELLASIAMLQLDHGPVLCLQGKAKPVSNVENVRNMCLCADDKDDSVLFVGSSEGAIKRWRVHNQTLSLESTVFKCKNCVMSLVVVNNVIFAGTSNGELYAIDGHGQILKRHQIHQGAIMTMAYSDVLICGGDDGWISVVDVQCHELRHKWQAHNSSVTALHLNQQTGHLYSCSVDQSVCCWGVDGFSLVWSCNVPLTDVGCMCRLEQSLLFLGGRGLISLDVDCVVAQTCTEHTKYPRVA